MSVSTNAVSASIRARRKVNQLTEFCPKGWETKFRNTISYINALLRGVGHSGSEMLDANSRGQLYTFIVGAIRYNNGISAITVQLTVYSNLPRCIVNAQCTIGDFAQQRGAHAR